MQTGPSIPSSHLGAMTATETEIAATTDLARTLVAVSEAAAAEEAETSKTTISMKARTNRKVSGGVEGDVETSRMIMVMTMTQRRSKRKDLAGVEVEEEVKGSQTMMITMRDRLGRGSLGEGRDVAAAVHRTDSMIGDVKVEANGTMTTTTVLITAGVTLVLEKGTCSKRRAGHLMMTISRGGMTLGALISRLLVVVGSRDVGSGGIMTRGSKVGLQGAGRRAMIGMMTSGAGMMTRQVRASLYYVLCCVQWCVVTVHVWFYQEGCFTCCNGHGWATCEIAWGLHSTPQNRGRCSDIGERTQTAACFRSLMTVARGSLQYTS